MLLREQESFVGVSDSNDVRIKKLDTYATATVKTTVGGWSGLANVPNKSKERRGDCYTNEFKANSLAFQSCSLNIGK